MKHYVFPTTADADAFIADLKAQNVVESVTGTTSFRRQTEVAPVATTATQEKVITTEAHDGGGNGAEMAGGALAGGALGTAAGVAAGALVAATGGLAAVPIVLGLGIGAAAGMANAAVNGHGEDGNVKQYEDSYTLADDHYDRLNTAVGTDGRAVAVEDNIPADIADATAKRHNGRLV